MTEATINLTITLDDDYEESQALSSVLEVHGVPEDVVSVLILQVLEGRLRTMYREKTDKEKPLADDEVMSAMSFLNTRLMLVDTIMHLPIRDNIGVTLDLDG